MKLEKMSKKLFDIFYEQLRTISGWGKIEIHDEVDEILIMKNDTQEIELISESVALDGVEYYLTPKQEKKIIDLAYSMVNTSEPFTYEDKQHALSLIWS